LVSLQHTSAASRVLISDGGQPIGPVPLRRFDRPYGFHHCAVSTIGTEQLELADVRGGSFDGISSHRDDARPVVFDSAVQVSAVQPLWNAHAHDRSNHMSSAAVLFVPSTIAGHAPTRSSCVVFRYAAIGLPQPCRAMPNPPSLPFSLSGAPGIRPFAGLLPRMGGVGISADPGPRVVSHADVCPPRFIFVGVTDRLIGCDSSKG